MEMHFDELLEKVTSFIKSEATTETIVGDAFKLGDFNCVPVMKVGMGFGSGGGEGTDPKKGQGTGGGAGGGIGLAPIGFLINKGDEISFISTEKPSALSAAFEKVPDLIEKIMDKKQEEEATA